MGNAKCIGCCCSAFLVGFIFLATWLIITSIESPKISLLNLQLPVDADNKTLSFSLKFDNPNYSIGIQYSNLNTSFHYPWKNQSSSFADVVVPGFYQEYNKKPVKTETGEAKKFNWTKIIGNGTTVDIGVRVVGTVRFKRYISWVSSRSLSVGVVPLVDKQGTFNGGKGWRLKSSATTRVPDIGCYLVLSLVIIFSIGLTNFSI